MAEEVTEHFMPISVNTSRTAAMGLWTDAKNMLEAAMLLKQNEDLQLLRPLYYLLGHGVEEAFKAFVMAKGGSLQCLKSISHDLELARDWANTAGLAQFYTLSDQDNQAIKTLNPYYKAKEFEYRVRGYKSYPALDVLISLLDGLLRSIKNVCITTVKEKA